MLEDCTDPSQAMGWRTQPQATPEVPQAPEKRPSWWTKGKPIWFVLAGFLLEFLTFLFSYDVQARELKLYGRCYSDAYEYMLHLPLSLLTILGIVLIVIGFWKMYRRTPEEKELFRYR